MRESQFRVIPVLDVKNAQAVHAVGGIRSHYRPVQSRLHPSCDPLELARAYRDQLGLPALYLADLDAIAGQAPNLSLYHRLNSLGLQLWIDAGITNTADYEALADLSDITIVLGLETLAGTATLRKILDRADPARIVLSLDLFEGAPRLPGGVDWGTSDPGELAGTILDIGVRRLLLLDLARVGTGRGTGTVELLSRLRVSHPAAEVCVGGGITGIAELITLRDAGAAAALVGSALHDGRIGQDELARLADDGLRCVGGRRP